ncbi:MAG: transglycosylase SLT domain-containing protein [Bacteriovoracaceae bacterium]|nr:transglycosylase SLT domain-containing protein [Bacteriovoracaceae bacterium]
MNLLKVTALLAMVCSVSIFSADINFRSISKVTSKAGASVYIIEVSPSGEEILKPAHRLEENHEFSFRPNVFFKGAHYYNDQGELRSVRGRYFGSLLISTKGLDQSERQEIEDLNKRKIFIYEWKIDKSDYIKRAFNEKAERADLIPRNSSFRWDELNPGQSWTAHAAKFIKENGKVFFDESITDVSDFCPGFSSKNKDEKTAFWIHLINSLSIRESKFDPLVSNNEGNFGDGSLNVTSRGLLQISFQSASASRYKSNGCKVTDANSLHDPKTSIECGLAIFKTWLKNDGCISCKNNGGKYRGISRYWSPLRERHQVRCSICSNGVANIGFREEIIAETSETPACQ